MTIEIEQLDEKRYKGLKAELRMTEKSEQEDIRMLRDWVEKQPHLPSLPADKETDEWMVSMLTAAKNRPEKMKKMLDVYFSARSAFPELFKNRDPLSKAHLTNVESTYLMGLPRLTPDGYRIYYFRHKTSDPDVYTPTDMLRRALMMEEVICREDKSLGEIILFDLTNGSLTLWSKYNVTLFVKFIAIMLKAYPSRLKAVYIIHAPSFISQVLKLILPMLSEKVSKRVVHLPESETDKIHDLIPKSCLPKELEGTMEASLDEINELWQRKLSSRRDWFLKDETLKADQSKRPFSQVEGELFGMNGTFRALAVD